MERLDKQLKEQKTPEGPFVGEVSHLGTAHFMGQDHLARSAAAPGFEAEGVRIDMILGHGNKDNRTMHWLPPELNDNHVAAGRGPLRFDVSMPEAIEAELAHEVGDVPLTSVPLVTRLQQPLGRIDQRPPGPKRWDVTIRQREW